MDEQSFAAPDLSDPASLRAVLRACRRDLAALDGHQLNDGAAYPLVRDGSAEPQMVGVISHLQDLAASVERLVESTELQAARAATLAREVDHRIRNSLQTVISLLHRQASKARSAEVRDALKLAGVRVYAVAQLHTVLARMSGREGEARVELAPYLEELCAALRGALLGDGEPHRLLVELEPCRAAVDVIQPLGIIVAELVANALRHAFPSGTAPGTASGTVSVIGARRRDGCYQIRVEDDGCGLPRGFDLRRLSGGLGLRVVTMLADSLHARLTADGNAGTRFTLTLPHDAPHDP